MTKHVTGWTFAVQIACCLSAVPGLLAQTTGNLRGNVKDPAGLVIADAKVTVTIEGTHASRTGTTDARGDFVFASLPVGLWTVAVESAGFKKFVQRAEVTLGHVVVVDATLQIGEVSQSVTAEAEAPLVETTSTQLGAVMNSRAVVESASQHARHLSAVAATAGRAVAAGLLVVRRQ